MLSTKVMAIVGVVALGLVAAGTVAAQQPDLPPVLELEPAVTIPDSEPDSEPNFEPNFELASESEVQSCVPCPKPSGPVPSPHKGVFYDNDFSYLEDPSNDQSYLGDLFKRRSVGRTWMVDAGGEYRIRHQNEHILNRTNDFLLHRTRLYVDVHAGDWFRAYIEGIDAVTEFDDVTPRGIEENRFDALNLFGDLRVWNGCRGDLWLRGGRQEMLYGAQRMISPLDWSNTRRTFDGLKGFWRGERWNADAWWTRPVPFGQHIAGGQTDHNFDHPDQSQEFAGVWLSRKGLDNHKLDFYYLRYNEYDAAPNTFEYNTFGARWEGSCEQWLWEAEGGYQFGAFNALTHSAGFYTLGLGRKFDLPWSPVAWIYYDWASGDQDPNDGVHQTFNQMFPLGHKYFGFMDIVGRQNIEDWNFRVAASPHKRVKLMFWWHIFHLQQATDALYSAGGGGIRFDPTGAAGTNVGQELDLTAKFIITPRCDLLLGYSHLYSGAFLANTLGGIAGEDFYYGQFTLRF